MSDTNYVNTYVNLAVETLHSYLNDILQLRTQVKLTENLVSERDQALAAIQNEKDGVIASLQQEIEQLRQEKNSHLNDEGEMQKLRDNAATWEFQYNNMMNKVSHMDTLTNQYNELKNQYLDKEQQVGNLTSSLNDVTQRFESTKNELEAARVVIQSLEAKLDKLTKKEEKVSPPKKGINKEDTKPSIPVKLNVVKVEEPKEIDDF